MEDLFWNFYCCKWKLTLCCFHVDSQKPLDTMHRGDVEEEMAASSPRSQSLVSQTVRTNSSATGKLHSNPSCLTQKGDSNLVSFPSEERDLVLGTGIVFSFLAETPLHAQSVFADVCLDPNFHHFYWSCLIKSMIFVCVLNGWVWLVENSKKQTNLGLGWSNTFRCCCFIFFCIVQTFTCKNNFFYSVIRTPFWSMLEHAGPALVRLRKLCSRAARRLPHNMGAHCNVLRTCQLA